MTIKIFIVILAILTIIISSLSTYVIIEKADNAPSLSNNENGGQMSLNVIKPTGGQIGINVVDSDNK